MSSSSKDLLRGKKCLKVGVHSDADIEWAKGCPPVYKEEERYHLTRSLRIADEVVFGAPFIQQISTLDKYECAFSVHGDDVTLGADGVDSYAEVKAANRYVEVPRTRGISTTILIDRILNGWPTGPGQPVIYVPGAFELLTGGHSMFLEKVERREKGGWRVDCEVYSEGAFVLLGLWDDETIRSRKGESGRPCTTLLERAVVALATKYVSDVVLGAPLEITAELVQRYNITSIVYGRGGMEKRRGDYEEVAHLVREVDSGSQVTTDTVIRRVLDHRDMYEVRQETKTSNGMI